MSEMESSEDKGGSSDDVSQLSRNRSFKSKQLVRSQALRESTSPPRTISPAAPLAEDCVKETRTLDTAVHASDDTCSVNEASDETRHPVEIQITTGSWDVEPQSEQQRRTKRWLGQNGNSGGSRSRDDQSVDLLSSNDPRLACVCGVCTSCTHCRGRTQKEACPIKQDSGIVCSEDCPDCSDPGPAAGSIPDGGRKAVSLDVECCKCHERKEKPKTVSLSRADSGDRFEPIGAELVCFIKETLNKNPRDRMTLLKIERELRDLVLDSRRHSVRFPVMTSYGRMLVHRCASLFQLSHHLDQSNKNSVLVSKSGPGGGRMPCTSFKQWCTTNFPPSPQRCQGDITLAKSILKRDAHSLDDAGAGAASAARSKSLEQREREYACVRRRIFSSDNCNTQDDTQWPWLSTGPVKLLTPDVAGRNKLLKVQSLEGGSGGSGGAGEAGGAGGAWRARGAVSKSHSFGGYAGDAPPAAPALSRQGDLASSSWRLSPSSSGYRTLSLHSTDSVTPSPTGGASPEPGGGGAGEALVWAVTDLASVPPGALVIHPQTGRPLTNPDGSVYHFDPNNPPVLYDPNVYAQQQKDQKCDQRRGRLEKQHSFIDSECDCPAEKCRNKICGECRHQDTQQRNNTLKPPTQPEPKTIQKPASPTKNRFEQNAETPTNNNSLLPAKTYETTNQKPSLDPSTNQRPSFDNNFKPAYQRPGFENRQVEPANQRPLEQRFENRSQSFEVQKVNSDVNNHAVKTNNESPEYVQQQSYPQRYSNDEFTTPPQPTAYTFLQSDMATLQAMAQAKSTPVAIADPNIRPVSLTNIMYPAQVPQGYPYLSHWRMDQQLQPVYQQMMQAQIEEQKQLAPSPHATDNTFRIDPSYPYAPVDYASCGQCVDPAAMQHQQRVYNLPYAQVEPAQQVLQQAYPVNNVILPQNIQQYPYQEQVSWPVQPSLLPTQPPSAAHKLFVQELYPYVQYPVCAPYSLVYPQMIPQGYPVCQPIYSAVEKQSEAQRRGSAASSQRHSKHNSVSGSSRTTPLQTPPDDKKVPYEESKPDKQQLSRQSSTEVTVKIHEIKEQMSHLNTRDREGPRREEWRRRNSGGGILGSYPAQHFNGGILGRPSNDGGQLSSAARAIVNSIRNMQAKTYNHPDNRRPDYQQYRNDRDRPPFRRPRPEYDRQERSDERPQEGRFDVNRNRGVMPVQCRPPFVLRQMSPGTWCRRSPGPVHPVMNHPRRPHPDARNPRR